MIETSFCFFEMVIEVLPANPFEFGQAEFGKWVT
jgi:hypothetical protein